MNAPEEKITREELHRLVWTRTFVKLAKELGYTYPELAAICEDLNIPRPRGGYWNRLELGTAETQDPLPPTPPGKPTEIPRGSRKTTVETAPDASKTPAPLNRPESSKVVAECKDAPKPKSANPDNDSKVVPTLPKNSDVRQLKQAAIVPDCVEYTREQLYEAIWSKPCMKLAAELGISDVGLAKTCRRMGIPRPPRGYWARIEAGEKLRREALRQAMPGQDKLAVFQIQQNIARRQELSANHIQSALHDCRCEAVELPAEGSEFHPIAEQHRKAIEKAKPDERGFVRVEGKNLFHCAISVALAPRLVRALHAVLGELEDREFDFKPGSNEFDGLKIIRDEHETSLHWSEEMLEWEREPTEADKRKPSWTWQLKETKPAGKLNVEVKAYGAKGKRRWTEDEGRTLEEVLGVVVEKIEAIFRGYEDQRLREAAWAKQRQEQAKREAEQRAIKAEQEAQEEKARKERERIHRHEKKLEEIATQRRDNLASAAQDWIEIQGILAYIHFCEERWRREGNGTLTKGQTSWLSWARQTVEKLGTKSYPDPSRDGNFDASAVPVDGPYPETRQWERDEPEETQPPEIKPPAYSPPPPDQFPFWLMHRHR
jgi:hypothetical protein